MKISQFFLWLFVIVYIISPIDIIPGDFTTIVGLVDDFVVAYIGVKLNKIIENEKQK